MGVEILFGRKVFDKCFSEKRVHLYCDNTYIVANKEKLEKLEHPLIPTLEKMVHQDPDSRPTLEEII